MALFLGWTQYKGNQVRKQQEQQAESLRADSLAQAAAAAANTMTAAQGAQPVSGGTALSAAPDPKHAAALAPTGEAFAAAAVGADAEPHVITVQTERFNVV